MSYFKTYRDLDFTLKVDKRLSLEFFNVNAFERIENV